MSGELLPVSSPPEISSYVHLTSEKLSLNIVRNEVRVVEPLIDGQPVTDFIAFMVDRVCCFVDERCAYAMQAKMPNGLSIREIPMAERKEDIKERFQLALVGGGMRIWALSYHDSKFEET